MMLFSFKPQFHIQTNQLKPQLILISGSTGTGKSTLGMSVALRQGILKCISTDTIRQVLRTYNNSPALHRSSYSGEDDPVMNWLECCDILQDSINSLVTDAIQRGSSLVLEGVHMIPSNILIDKWIQNGGSAIGCVLTISNQENHRHLIIQRGKFSGKGAEQQVKAFQRIRTIQEEMLNLAQVHNWLIVEQQLQQDPVEIINKNLTKKEHN